MVKKERKGPAGQPASTAKVEAVKEEVKEHKLEEEKVVVDE